MNLSLPTAMTPQAWALFLVGGVLSGFLNAAASSGSAITLPLLLSLGLPPAVANGTNRMGVLVGFVTAFCRFQRAGAITWKLCLRLLPLFLGMALLGAALAAALPMPAIRQLIEAALLVAFALVLLRPHRWLRESSRPGAEERPSALVWLLMAAVGFWSGLIVLDAATYLLVGLVVVGGVALPRANAAKVVLIGAATLVSVAVFLVRGEIDWFASLPLMLGSALGGWLGAALALGPRAKLWIYRLLLASLGFEALRMLWGWLKPQL